MTSGKGDKDNKVGDQTTSDKGDKDNKVGDQTSDKGDKDNKVGDQMTSDKGDKDSKVGDQMTSDKGDKDNKVSDKNRKVDKDTSEESTNKSKAKEKSRPKGKELQHQVVQKLEKLVEKGHRVVLVFDAVNRLVAANKISQVSHAVVLCITISSVFMIFISTSVAYGCMVCHIDFCRNLYRCAC